MGLFLMGAIVARLVHIENAATATFLLNLGLTLAFAFAKLITLLTAVRQFPDELEARTLYPLLAKPLSRGQYLLGKWAASLLIGIITLGVLGLMAYLPVPKMEAFSYRTFAQTLLLQVVSLGMLAALSILFSLVIPKVLSIVILALLVLAGSHLSALVVTRTTDTPAGAAIRWVVQYIPDFGQLDLLQQFTSGGSAISSLDLLVRVLYAAIITAFSLAAAVWLLERRQL
jgi:ABC-type transport system involved in multi-copper enzyme maturation permease subunit